MLLTICYTHI